MRFSIFYFLLLIALLAACSDPFAVEENGEQWELVEPENIASPPPLDCPDPTDEEVTYHGDDLETCREMEFGSTGRPWCDHDQEMFIDDCGCGCIGDITPQDCEVDGCPTGQYCHYEDGVCGDTGAQGVCEPIPRECTDDVAEVCGCDGEIYTGSSSCAAPQAGVDSHPDFATCGEDPPCIDPSTDEVDDGYCFIDERCYLDGNPNPEDECQFCDARGSQFAWAQIPGCAPQIDAGRHHSCVVDSDQQPHCWPDDDQPGGRTDPPPTTFFELSTGHFHTCGLDTNEQLRCWGSDHEELTDVPQGSFRQVSASRWYSCAIDDTRHVQCWGRPDLAYGQSQPPGGTFVQISTAPEYGCGIRLDGDLHCWGNIPGTTSGVSDRILVDVSANILHACALDREGRAHCWGQNTYDQLDAPDGRFHQITAGRNHSCAIDESRSVHCWGNDLSGQSSPPDGAFRHVSAGTDHSCAYDMDGRLHCWGAEERIPPSHFSAP